MTKKTFSLYTGSLDVSSKCNLVGCDVNRNTVGKCLHRYGEG